MRVTSALFEDETTIIGGKGELVEGVREVKRVMEEWKERNNQEKEEVLDSTTEAREGD